MTAEDQPVYVALCPGTRQMTLVNLPVRLIPYAEKLAEHLIVEYYGQPVNEDLLYCMNWSARQWIARAMDDIDFQKEWTSGYDVS